MIKIDGLTDVVILYKGTHYMASLEAVSNIYQLAKINQQNQVMISAYIETLIEHGKLSAVGGYNMPYA